MKALNLLVVVAALAGQVQAAPISWQGTAPTFSGANDSLNPTYNGINGLTAAGATTYSTGPTTVTTSGLNASVNFDTGTAFTIANVTNYGGYGTGFTSSPSNPQFDAVLSGGSGDGGNSGVLTANNLVLDQPYAVQVFSVDDRGCCSGRSNYFTGSDAGGQSPTIIQGNNQYVIGAFTANAATQSINITPGQGASPDHGYTVNAAVAYTPNISWAAPQPITTADAALAGFLDGIHGTVVSATGWGNGQAETVTLSNSSTVTFQNGTTDNTALAAPAADATGYAGIGSHSFFTGGGNTTGNAAFDNVLDAATYDGGGQHLITLTGLTPGQEYSVQLFADDTRGCCTGREMSFTGIGNSGSSAVVTEGNADYIVGTFFALGSTQVIQENFLSGAGNINALVLRAVPEPSSVALLALGAAGLLVAARRTRKIAN